MFCNPPFCLPRSNHEYPAEFRKRVLGGNAGNVSKFWDQMHKHPAYLNRPMKHQPRGLQHRPHCIPISIHGDGVATIGSGKKWARMCEVLSWSSALCVGHASYIKNFLIVAVAQMLLLSRDVDASMDYIWRILCWSMYCFFFLVSIQIDRTLAFCTSRQMGSCTVAS